jgi:hypothetical protein
MSWLSSFLHPGQPYKDAQGQMDKYYGDAQGALQPYMDFGTQTGGGLSEMFQNLLHPEKLQDEWMKSYETSEQARNMQEQAKQSGLDTASAMGLMGSSPALQAIQQGQSQIGAADRQSYLDALMDKYKTGIGLGENIYGTGASAAGQFGQQGMHMGETSGGLAGGAGQAGGRLFGQGLGVLGSIGGSFLGPMGTAVGGALGKGIGNWLTGGK